MYGLGAGAVEFIINHAKVSIAFVKEKKDSSGTILTPKYLNLTFLTQNCHGYNSEFRPHIYANA